MSLVLLAALIRRRLFRRLRRWPGTGRLDPHPWPSSFLAVPTFRLGRLRRLWPKAGSGGPNEVNPITAEVAPQSLAFGPSLFQQGPFALMISPNRPFFQTTQGPFHVRRGRGVKGGWSYQGNVSLPRRGVTVFCLVSSHSRAASSVVARPTCFICPDGQRS